MKNKIFRILIILVSIVPAATASIISFFSTLEGSLVGLMFLAATVIYGEYVYETIKLFKRS